MSPPELDRVTLQRARRGDPEACRALVRRYEAPIFALIGRMLPPERRGEVEDLAQETFLRAFRALRRFDPDREARLSTWILTIATRLCIDALRKRRREVPLGDHPRPGGARGDVILERAQLIERLRGAIEALPEAQREIIRLRALEGLSYEEIAAALQCAPGTVASRLGRARRALRVMLGGIR